MLSYYQRSEKRREYVKKYNARPDVKAKKEAFKNRPEVKEHDNKRYREKYYPEYAKRPETMIMRRIYHLKDVFNITQREYELLLKKQKGNCAICKKSEKSKGGFLFIDHSHNCCKGRNSCGKCIRGLLCRQCNTGLGFFQDDVKLIGRAIKYLKSFKK